MATNAALRIAHLTKKPVKSMKLIDHAKRAYIVNLRSTSLASVKSMSAQFDPWNTKSESIRSLAYSLSVPKIRDTNLNSTMRVDVKSDLSAPKFTVDFIDGHKAVFHTENLNRVELIKMFNALCQERIPAAVSKPGPQTKSSNNKPKPKKK